MRALSQLRIYDIAPGRMQQFVREWKAGVVPLRLSHGFRVDGAWVVEGEDSFVWILTYEGDETFESRDEGYYASPERKSLEPDPARHIDRQQTRFMRSVLDAGER